MAITLPPTDPEREWSELRAYLGPAFDTRLAEQHEQAVIDEWEAASSEEELYRTSHAYLYDLTAFATHPTKLPYHDAIVAAFPDGARLLDVGCGIGWDGLRLLEAGYDVSFADFDNPSVAYLRWRLERRGLSATVHDLDAGPLPGDHDLTYCFDVLEHVADPFALLGRMEGTAAQVLVNVLEPEPGETPVHHALPVDAVLAHVRERGLLQHDLLNVRSHLVRYRGRR